MTSQVLLLELNEVNFDYVRTYAEQGRLPRLGRLIAEHGVAKTVSEQRYEELEPWIQWVTAHTGLAYKEHQVFRLGDIVKRDIPQLWEWLEERGLRVGAISPMNAMNRTRNAAFWIPDPWTPTQVTGGVLEKHLHAALCQAVNDNATGRLTAESAAWLLAGLARFARQSNYLTYLKLARFRGAPWRKAIFLDRLLADIFIRETRRKRPNFASLFLNAGAHIQHHYMFNSLAYEGAQRNPDWYISKGQDPLGEVYSVYDGIVAQVQDAFPSARIVIATGLHQDPHGEVTFYWRLKDHAAFLNKIGVPFRRVEPRMSRDFVVECGSEAEAAKAQEILRSTIGENDVPLFEVDYRGQDLFVMLTWPHDITDDFQCTIDGRRFYGFRDDVAFVAIKNGQHNGEGYFLDTGAKTEGPACFPLAEVPRRISGFFGLQWGSEDWVQEVPG